MHDQYNSLAAKPSQYIAPPHSTSLGITRSRAVAGASMTD